jgi:hypothetical protein
MIFSFVFVGILHGLNELERYLDLTEKHLKKETKNFQTLIEEEARQMIPDERDEYFEFMSDNEWQLQTRFPRILRNSFLVSTCSLFEIEMRGICKILQKDFNIPIPSSALNGDILERIKNYWKLAKLKPPSANNTWKEINQFFLVRNCIVHNGGYIKGFRDELELNKYGSKMKILSDDTIQQEIALNEEFCKHVIKTLRLFLTQLDKDYRVAKSY